jgi:XTP/dITP diphosphohydrolase
VTDVKELVLASHNPGKLSELRQLLGAFPLHLRSAAEFGIEPPEEPAPTFVENALIKARHVARLSGRGALADDSGLIVPALKGQPGVLSARFAGPGADDRANLERLLDLATPLDGAQRTCRFVCVIVVLSHADDPLPLIAEGVWEGRLLRSSRGSNGFGYDPIFLDAETGRSAAELSAEQKHRVSHRGRALASLSERLAAKLR